MAILDAVNVNLGHGNGNLGGMEEHPITIIIDKLLFFDNNSN